VTPTAEDEAIDLRQLRARILARRWWVLACVIVSAAAFAVAAFEIRPVYRASTVLIPASAERNSLSSALSSTLGQLGGIASLAGVSLGSSDAGTEEALAVLQSRQFTERFINDLNLMPELFAGKWDAANGKWRIGWWDPPTPAKAVKYFDKKIRTVTRDKRSSLVTLQIDWRDRDEAAAWANQLAQRLNAEMRGRAIEQAAASLSYLEKELDSTSVVATRDSISRLIEAQVKQRMLANVTQEYAFRIVDKAMAPDSDDPIWPRKLLFFIGGPLLGLAVGIAAVLAADFLFATNGRPAVER
jgi:uncharacterized protein involved in exopolysaccharide biosynthesis